jgi:hypothetical protein
MLCIINKPSGQKFDKHGKKRRISPPFHLSCFSNHSPYIDAIAAVHIMPINMITIDPKMGNKMLSAQVSMTAIEVRVTAKTFLISPSFIVHSPYTDNITGEEDG